MGFRASREGKLGMSGRLGVNERLESVWVYSFVPGGLRVKETVKLKRVNVWGFKSFIEIEATDKIRKGGSGL